MRFLLLRITSHYLQTLLQATSTPLQNNNSNISTVTLESEINIKLIHTFERTNSTIVTTSDSSGLKSPCDQSRTVYNTIMHPLYSFKILTKEDFASLHPRS